MVITYIIVLFILSISKFLLTKRDGYYSYLQTNKIHPNNYDEVKLVESAVKNRTINDVQFHKFTDDSVVPAFEEILRNNNIKYYGDMNEIILKHVSAILDLKHKYNRARPWQVNKKLDVLYSYTAHTPAYPAGHAYQAWVLYRILSSKYPQLKEKLYKTAEYCDRVRVIAGLHYPSDGEFSKLLVMALKQEEL